jgi:metal-sulfur cluster biosynthetic enzyme
MDNLACLTDPELLVDVVELLVLEAVEVPVAELIDLLAAVAFALELHQTCPASEAAVRHFASSPTVWPTARQ